jgi:hypothetical protein
LLSAGEVPGLFTTEELAKELAWIEQKRDKDTSYTVSRVSRQQIETAMLIMLPCLQLCYGAICPAPDHQQQLLL